MRNIISIIFFSFFALNLAGQKASVPYKGDVTYVTSQTVYVKFASTENISIGDTLYMNKDGKLIPALEVKNLSSISCACSQIGEGSGVKLNDVVFARVEPPKKDEEFTDTAKDSTLLQVALQADSLMVDTMEQEKGFKEEIHGKISVASYTNFSNIHGGNSQRMRYTLAFYGNHLNDSKLSVESYISFVHSNTRWNEIQQNLLNGLKIYNLAARYDFNESTSLLLGRHINPKMSSIGAIDGLQFEKKFNSVTVGAFTGSRPAYLDYGVDINLFQYGAYVSHEHSTDKGYMQTTLAFAEQDNHSNTDRRFAYFQHSNSLIKKLYFFGSAEVDLYKKVNGIAQSNFDLTGIYLSLRYKLIKQLSLSASYSTRKNIIYYETYKEYIDRMLSAQAVQGWRLQLNLHPFKYFSIGANGSYRNRKGDPSPSKSIYTYITMSRIPGIKASATVSATFMNTSYIKGKIYSFGLSRDLIPGKLFSGVNFRKVDYQYYSIDYTTAQNIAELNLSWRMLKKLILSVYYEGNFEKPTTYNRIYSSLNWRF